MKGAQIRLIDENGADVADGEVEELLIRGANVFEGYWNDPRATVESLRAGWYHTGDMMWRGEGDELWFVSRKKDIVIRDSTNISPAEVEQAVAAHSAVERAAVVGNRATSVSAIRPKRKTVTQPATSTAEERPR